jgi:hypothetical protein
MSKHVFKIPLFILCCSLFCSLGGRAENPPIQPIFNFFNLEVLPNGCSEYYGDFTNTVTGTMTNGGKINFYANVTNNGFYNFKNASIEKFLGTTEQTLDGAQVFNSYDFLLNNPTQLKLKNVLNITHNFHFEKGVVVTDKTHPSELLLFQQGATYSNEDDTRFVDGYVGKKGNEMFTFPIGNNNELHPLTIPATTNVNEQYSAAFFQQSPQNFSQLSGALSGISSMGFWSFLGQQSTSVTLHWRSSSNITALTTDFYDLRVVGYNGVKWVDLGNALWTGNAQNGTITSNTFYPPSYQQITIGVVKKALVRVAAKAFLQGAYIQNTGLMKDSLRQKKYLPLGQPYKNLGTFAYNGTETTTQIVLDKAGAEAVIDWVLVELRDTDNPKTIIARQAGLLQRNGMIVAPNGVDALTFDIVPRNYYVAIRHRNHLGVMTAVAYDLNSTPTLIDFTVTTTANYGTHSQKQTTDGRRALWAGNANLDNKVVYAGTGTDLSPISSKVLTAAGNAGAFSKSFPVFGYFSEDVDMNGAVIYAGTGTDQSLISQNVLLHPENNAFSKSKPIEEQLPK